MGNFDWEQFFKEWKEEYKVDLFVKDGIIDPEVYEKEHKKILFILKDLHHVPTDNPTDEEKNGYIDLRKSLVEDNGQGKNWFNVVRWAVALLDGTFIKYMNDDKQHDLIKRISAINLKKQAGDSSVQDRCISCYAEKHKEKILKEIKMCQPDWIVACSSVVFEALAHNICGLAKDYKFEKIKLNERMENYGRYFDISEYLKENSPIHVVEYRHPSQAGRNGTSEDHHENMLKIREFLCR